MEAKGLLQSKSARAKEQTELLRYQTKHAREKIKTRAAPLGRGAGISSPSAQPLTQRLRQLAAGAGAAPSGAAPQMDTSPEGPDAPPTRQDTVVIREFAEAEAGAALPEEETLLQRTQTLVFPPVAGAGAELRRAQTQFLTSAGPPAGAAPRRSQTVFLPSAAAAAETLSEFEEAEEGNPLIRSETLRLPSADLPAGYEDVNFELVSEPQTPLLRSASLPPGAGFDDPGRQLVRPGAAATGSDDPTQQELDRAKAQAQTLIDSFKDLSSAGTALILPKAHGSQAQAKVAEFQGQLATLGTIINSQATVIAGLDQRNKERLAQLIGTHELVDAKSASAAAAATMAANAFRRTATAQEGQNAAENALEHVAAEMGRVVEQKNKVEAKLTEAGQEAAKIRGEIAANILIELAFDKEFKLQHEGKAAKVRDVPLGELVKQLGQHNRNKKAALEADLALQKQKVTGLTSQSEGFETALEAIKSEQAKHAEETAGLRLRAQELAGEKADAEAKFNESKKLADSLVLQLEVARAEMELLREAAKKARDQQVAAAATPSPDADQLVKQLTANFDTLTFEASKEREAAQIAQRELADKLRQCELQLSASGVDVAALNAANDALTAERNTTTELRRSLEDAQRHIDAITRQLAARGEAPPPYTPSSAFVDDFYAEAPTEEPTPGPGPSGPTPLPPGAAAFAASRLRVPKRPRAKGTAPDALVSPVPRGAPPASIKIEPFVKIEPGAPIDAKPEGPPPLAPAVQVPVAAAAAVAAPIPAAVPVFAVAMDLDPVWQPNPRDSDLVVYDRKVARRDAVQSVMAASSADLGRGGQRRQPFAEDVLDFDAMSEDPAWSLAIIDLMEFRDSSFGLQISSIYDPALPLGKQLEEIYHRASGGSTELLFVLELLFVFNRMKENPSQLRDQRLSSYIKWYARFPLVGTPMESQINVTHIGRITDAVGKQLNAVYNAAKSSQIPDSPFWWTDDPLGSDIEAVYANSDPRLLLRHNQGLAEMYSRNGYTYHAIGELLGARPQATYRLKQLCGVLWNVNNFRANFDTLLGLPGGALMFDLFLNSVQTDTFKLRILNDPLRQAVYSNISRELPQIQDAFVLLVLRIAYGVESRDAPPSRLTAPAPSALLTGPAQSLLLQKP